jgi:hypothetical protein
LFEDNTACIAIANEEAWEGILKRTKHIDIKYQVPEAKELAKGGAIRRVHLSIKKMTADTLPTFMTHRVGLGLI